MTFRFLCGFTCWSGATVAMIMCSVSYLQVQLGFEDTAGFLAAIACTSVLGALFSHPASNLLGAKGSLQASLSLYVVNLLFIVVFVHKPSHKLRAMAAGAFIGFCQGWVIPAQNGCWSYLVPGGRESEFMGQFAFAQIALTWLPPFVFTVSNEYVTDMRWGFFSNLVLLLWGIGFLYSVDMADATKTIGLTLGMRVAPGLGQHRHAELAAAATVKPEL